MNTLYKVLCGMGVLIGIFLILNNASASIQVVDVLGKNSINMVSVLQGRDTKIAHDSAGSKVQTTYRTAS